METTEVIGIGREAIWTVIYVAGPVLIIALSVGLIIGVFQAATSIQEMTLSFIPKLAALVATLLIFGDEDYPLEGDSANLPLVSILDNLQLCNSSALTYCLRIGGFDQRGPGRR